MPTACLPGWGSLTFPRCIAVSCRLAPPPPRNRKPPTPVSDDWTHAFFDALALSLWQQAIPDEQTADEAEFLQHALSLRADMPVLDVPCGDGRLAVAMAELGCRVTGVDASPAFLDAARARAAQRKMDVTWLAADMRHLPRHQFDAACCMGNSFGYLDAAGTQVFLDAVGQALRPGGRFLLDTAMAAESILPELSERAWQAAGDMLVLSEYTYHVETSRLETDYTFIQGTRRETRQATYSVFTLGEINRMLARAGLTARDWLADTDETPYYVGAHRLLLVAEKA